MTRDEAVELIARHQLAQLSHEGRNSLLLDWWSIDADDPDYGDLPDALKTTIAQADEPLDPINSLYDPLLIVALRRSFHGVLNSYLEARLASLGRPEQVDGAIERLVICPCCGYRTLEQSGNYEVCRVCFWEDDGGFDPDGFSGPNHMTLRQARENFAALGAVSEPARRHVLRDGTQRYARGDEE
jgi:hypothetical protein